MITSATPDSPEPTYIETLVAAARALPEQHADNLTRLIALLPLVLCTQAAVGAMPEATPIIPGPTTQQWRMQ